MDRDIERSICIRISEFRGVDERGGGIFGAIID